MPPESEDASPKSTLIDDADKARLNHIDDACTDALKIVAKMQEPSDEDLAILERALVQCFTVIGEAAHRLSPATKALSPTTPWQTIVAMRNFVVHVYWKIDRDLLIQTTHHRVPELSRDIAKLLRLANSGSDHSTT